MGDDLHVERELLDRYRTKFEKATERLKAAEEEVRRYGLAVQGLEAVVGGADVATDGAAGIRSWPVGEPAAEHQPTGDVLPAGTDSPEPRGELAVARILRENPGQGFSPKALTAALSQRGWVSQESKDPVAATRAAANRLRKKVGDVVFEGGEFYYRPKKPGPFVIEGRLPLPVEAS